MASDYRIFFKNKKITVMGLGLLGRGVGDVAFLAECGADLTVTDLKSEADLESSLVQLEKFPSINFVLGQHRIEDFQSCDMVIKAAGVPLDSPYIQAALDKNIPVYMSTALFAKFAPATLVGVTGTRGKSTVAQMVYEGLRAAGKSAHLGGNIRGLSTLAMLPEVRAGDIAVLELDSWQLQGFRDLKISPHVAVFTNLMPDHMNYYKDDMNLYFHDKAAIFENQGAEDFLIAGPDIAPRIVDENPAAQMSAVPALPEDWALSVPGEHNRMNAACARAALRALGVEDVQIQKSLEGFSGIDGRLKLIAEYHGIKFYNDSNATTPDALIAALKSFDKDRILLIAGGADKGLEVETLAKAVLSDVREIALLAGSGTQRLSALMPDVPVYDSLKEAFEDLVTKARSGDVLILSPGFASFGMFKNEYDRGDQFEEIVRAHHDKAA